MPVSDDARVGVVGAGPVGLYAAFRLVAAGHRVVVWERGVVGGNVDAWGHVTLFSALALNLPKDARGALEQGLGAAAPPRALPGDDAFLTGAEFRSSVLLPLAAWLRATGRCEVLEHAEVLGLARATLLKKEGIAATGDGSRSDAPFRAVVRKDGAEAWATCAAVVDCSGTYAAATAQRSGAGGLACPGEAAAEAAGRISRVIPDPSAFGGKRVAVLGGGYSAVTTVKLLADAEAAPSAITWLVRAAETRRPYARVDNDPLPQRDALAKFGNGLAGVGTSGTLSCVRGAELERVRTTATGLELALGDGRVVPCDHLVSLTGYRPDAALYRELHVHQCYASDGPMKLAATLLGASGGDCLAQAAPGAATLRNPEPRFYIVGMKSYGRNSSFLMRVGYEQVGLLVDELAPLVTLEPFQAPPGKADGPQDDAAAGIAVPVAS